jgi:hypothetical protein
LTGEEITVNGAGGVEWGIPMNGAEMVERGDRRDRALDGGME